MPGHHRQRLLLQYLEPSDALDRLGPEELVQRLSRTLDALPVTDLALGWRLGATLIGSLHAVIPAGVEVWRWVPIFVDPHTLP